MILFREISEFQGFLPVRAAFTLEQVQPFIEIDGQDELLRKLLGDALLEKLLISYEANSITADGYEDLLKKCQFLLANYSVLLYLPFALGDLGNGGFTVSTSGDAKAAPEWMSDKLEAAVLKRSDLGIESLLKFLEANVGDFPDWVDSPGYTLQKGSFLSNATDFDAIYKIGTSRTTFLALMPYKNLVEEGVIKNVLGTELYDSLKEKIADDSFTDEDKVILPMIKGALAFLTIAKAIPHLQLEVNDQGLQVNSLSQSNVRKVKSPAGDKQVAALLAACEAEGNKFITGLAEELTSNWEDYPPYPEPESTETTGDVWPVLNVGGVTSL